MLHHLALDTCIADRHHGIFRREVEQHHCGLSLTGLRLIELCHLLFELFGLLLAALGLSKHLAKFTQITADKLERSPFRNHQGSSAVGLRVRDA